jgi:hypothetical protein
MRAKVLLFALAFAVAVPAITNAETMNAISGNYVEFRNADVYTGPCFANGEVGLTGQEAVLGWQVSQGSWAGVPLAGLHVVAVVRANATLGDPYANPLPAKTVFFLDARANDAQRAALIQFAQSQTAGLLNDVVAIQSAPISFSSGRHGFVTLQVGSLVQLSTRMIGAEDEICRNEEVYYPPLAGHLMHVMPVAVVNSMYSGNHLGVTWHDSGRRSSFVGVFSE